MSNITLLVLCAGNSNRFGLQVKKQWLRIKNDPLWIFVTKRLAKFYEFDKIIITSSSNELEYMKNFTSKYKFVTGGTSRQESIKNSLKYISSDYVMVTDVARACIPKKVITTLIKSKEKADCIVPILNVSDTIIYNENTINRNNVKLVQTPQLSKTSILKKALNTNIEFTDDSSAIKNIGGSVFYIKGSIKSKKITFKNDLKELSYLKAPNKNFFTGIGYDIHPFEDNKKMYLGGIPIDVPYGFKAHSDGDVLIHSIIDALLGACGAGDIGEFFPDTNAEFKNINSKILLQKIVKFIYTIGYEIINIDLTIIAQQPKINPYKNKIKKTIALLLKIKKQFINIKATTTEKLGFIGRKEGIAVQSIVTLKYYNWTKK